MFGIDDLALALGAAKLIPKAWQTVAAFFGKETPETVIEAGKLIDSVSEEITKGKVTPEQRVHLKELLLQNDQVKDQVELEKLRLQYQDQAGGREVIRTALTSEDEYVRRTRPKILRRLFTFVCFYSVYAPVIYIDACWLGLKTAQLDALSSLLLWTGASLWTTFLGGFTGYTVVRSKYDKRGLSSDLPSLAGAAMGLVKRI